MNSSPSESNTVVTAQMRALLTLREWIVSGEIAGGERIAELPLVERLGVSRTPVRAALQRLAQEGLLISLPHGGYVVRQFTAKDIADTIALRGILEGTAARWAAERGVGADQLAAAHGLLRELDEVVAFDGEWDQAQLLAYGRLNDAFHDALFAMADSEALRLEWERIGQLPFAASSSFVLGQRVSPQERHRFRMAQDQHGQVLAAIEARQGTRAEGLMREHAQIAQRNLQDALAATNQSRAEEHRVVRLLAAQCDETRSE